MRTNGKTGKSGRYKFAAVWKLDVKMNQCCPKYWSGDLWRCSLSTRKPHRQTYCSDRKNEEEIFGTGCWGGGWVERPRVKTTGREGKRASDGLTRLNKV